MKNASKKSRPVRTVIHIPVLAQVRDRLTKNGGKVIGRQANVYQVALTSGDVVLRQRSQLVRVTKGI